ncbi:MAG: porin [Planctomycetaceae bacterium]|nr:porin [Planctomycetaceae bacterium]
MLKTYLTEKSVFDSCLFENRLIGKKSKSRISFYGWMLTGITVNNHGATNKYDDDGERTTHAYGYNVRPGRPGITDQSGNSYVLMLEQPSDWKVNQLWFGAKRELTNRLDWGFQTDFVYGPDARYARNWGDYTLDAEWGSGDYFAAFTNLFVSFGTKELSVKVGKFPGGFAYEGLAAPREFFYSHANICYGRPFTTQGVVVDWKPSNKWTFSCGWTAGVFTSFENPYHDSAFLGKATYNFTKNTALAYKIFYNAKGSRSVINNGGIDCLNTLIFTCKINKKWFYMGEIAYTDNNYYGQNWYKTTGEAWGVNNHLIYTVNDKLSVGLRGEFHHSRNSFFDMAAVSGGKGGDLWNITFAANYKINPKVTFRPEIRYDYTDYKNGYRPFGGSETENDQLCGGVSFVVVF